MPMKRNGIVHAELSGLMARLGHTDRVVIADRGLPLPRHLPMVDLALVPNVIDFCTVLDVILADMVVQAHTVASEAAAPAEAAGRLGGGVVLSWLDKRADRLGRRITISHEDFKAALPEAAFAIRTGEQTPYANLVLHCGVPF